MSASSADAARIVAAAGADVYASSDRGCSFTRLERPDAEAWWPTAVTWIGDAAVVVERRLDGSAGGRVLRWSGGDTLEAVATTTVRPDAAVAMEGHETLCVAGVSPEASVCAVPMAAGEPVSCARPLPGPCPSG